MPGYGHARAYASRDSIPDAAHLRVLEAYIETLKAENESLKRQLTERERCPWWCRRLASSDNPPGPIQSGHLPGAHGVGLLAPTPFSLGEKAARGAG